MTQILASGKTGAQRYANNDLAKPVAALDMIQIGQQTRRYQYHPRLSHEYIL